MQVSRMSSFDVLEIKENKDYEKFIPSDLNTQ